MSRAICNIDPDVRASSEARAVVSRQIRQMTRMIDDLLDVEEAAKEPLDEQARTLCNRHEFAEQCLIYFSLLNVIYFVNCAVLFLKFGTRTNIVSIAAIAL